MNERQTAFDPGFDIRPTVDPMGFEHGADVFAPEAENRTLDSIRGSLMDPACAGPEIVYSIVMDIGKRKHRALLERMHLLYGAVTYAAGRLGDEPIRSQGHIHKISSFSGWSTPEVYEIWSGAAIIYMQEFAEDNPGRCYAVYAAAGDVVVVPPYWTHATVSADPRRPLTFGAWCDRDYGFVYDGVRRHGGIAWFPVFDAAGRIGWKANPNYLRSELICKTPEPHPDLGIRPGESIYRTFERDPDTFLYVPSPQLREEVWKRFIP